MQIERISVCFTRTFIWKRLMMQHEAILYSLDPKVSISWLQDFVDYDENKYSKLQDRLSENNVWAIMMSDQDFHHKFLPIRPRVNIIYYMGDISLLNRKILGIVWPRQMSSYGKKVLEALFTSSQNYDFITISGMAEGVDQLCHQLSRENNIPTIAVLGWGLWRYLKRPERTLIEQIVADGGLVISEFKLWERPTHYTFPQRNRLIAWLADVLFLPEAGENSGSLITVDFAIAMKKPVYATPSSIFSPTSAGILQAMETGRVQPIFDLQNFLATHFTSKHTSSRPKTTISLTDQEQAFLWHLSLNQGIEIHSLVKTSWVALQEAIQLLTLLEIKWLVVQEEPGRYMLK